MSIRINQGGRKGKSGRTGGFSSLSSGSSFNTRASSTSGAPQWNAPITAVSINKSLLAPLNLEIDPSIQAVRTQEKNQIKTLNNRFATFIDKVRFLEQQNKMLETKWKLLEEQTSEPSQIDPMFNAYIANLTRQLTQITNDRDRLNLENNCAHKLVEDYKTKYEEEINLRNVAENDFVLLKKDVDAGYLSKMNLEDIVSSVAEEVTFLKSLYEEELRELHANMQDTSVVVQMDNSRALNMDQIVSEVKVQYENIAARSREEAEGWYKTKFDQMSAQADQFGSELRSSKGEIAELNRLIGRLQNEVQAAKEQCVTLEAQVAEADQRGEAAVRDAKATIRDLEVALQRTKQDMARQVRDYQDLMNVKLGLDIEISTYRKLLEGEEDRIGQQSITNIHTVPNQSPRVTNYQPSKSSAPILIKTVETHDSTISYRSK